MTAPLSLSCEGLQVRLGETVVLAGVGLTLAAGRWTCVVGPNGAGKSTLLRCLGGLLRPAQGQVFLGDRPLDAWPRRERARTLSWLGQNQPVADDLRALDVVMLGRLPHQGWLSAPSAQDRQAVRDAMLATQAWDWRDRAMGSLSGGERQRVLLARALAVQAPVLLMDEPLAHLDPPHQADWLALVRTLVARGHTVVSVLHEVSLALCADDLVLLRGGRLTHHGSRDDLATHRALEAVFDQRVRVVPVEGQWAVLPHVAGAGGQP